MPRNSLASSAFLKLNCLSRLYIRSLCHMQVCKYIDIPLQHISNMTLLSMNRPPQEHTVKLLQKLRQRIPHLVLRTTFISGFPGKFPS